MPAQSLQTLDVRTRPKWRTWLRQHHASSPGVWLVFHKRHTAIQCLEYGEAVEEALCFGWVDSLIKRLDDDRYARKFTPRKPDSAWSTINRKRYAKLKAAGLLEAPGLARPPTNRSGDLPIPAGGGVPAYIEEQLKTHTRAWQFFERLAPSHKRMYVAWIDSAKRDETKQKRIREVIAKLAAGKKPGL
jgi:uncharacterized protein YdeI (YjbR/CyaY-like superfamily)